MGTVVKRFKLFQMISMIFPALLVVIGLVLMGYEKYLTAEMVYRVISIIIIISGLASMAKYLYDGFANDIYKYEIVSGLGMLILGIFMFVANMEDVFGTLGIFFGIYYLLSTGVKAYYTFKLFKANEEIFPLYLVITVLFAIMSILAIINPFKSFMLITRLVSIFLVVGGAFDLMLASLFKKRSKNVLKIFE